VWIVVALFAVPLVHLAATLLEVALGGRPVHWFYPPVRPEHVAGLVFFSVGEEFGWRGFAHPRMVERYGSVAGSLVLGLVWAIWHLAMTVSPATGTLDLFALGTLVVSLPLFSVVFAWVLERGRRSMAVAIALHAGAHLDNIGRAPQGETRLWVLRLVVLVGVTALAARGLVRRGASRYPTLPISKAKESPSDRGWARVDYPTK
jgi:membrane protease YdiL (CAAX protease family)